MGFVLLGLAAANTQAVAGAVLQMFSHGVIAGLLFAVVGRMVYERTHTRKLADLRGIPLHRKMPFAALTFVLAGLASMGMPGFSGFPAELTILIGTWKTSPLWATFAAGGVLVAAAFTLRAIQVSFFGTTDRQNAATAVAAGPSHAPYPRITWAERAGAMLLIAATVYVGLKPDVLLQWITPALQSPLMQAALKGGTP
jgi:NADH-quinone oxidoreductase subunit M